MKYLKGNASMKLSMHDINAKSSPARILKTTILLAIITISFLPGSLPAQSGQWVSAYYAGWSQGWNNNGVLPAEEIDYSAVTNIIHFSLVPNSDGTLDYSSNSITQTNSSALLQAAHAAGKKVSICVGGWATDGGFAGATSVANRASFVANLVSFITSRGYDGIDIDWEPLSSSDGTQYTAFITALRTALNLINPRPLLTAATAWQPSILAQVQSKFDQINIMTYDLAGAWPGWVTWHNSALYDGGYTFPSSGGRVPSSDGMVDEFIASGISAAKLGIGIDFYGYVWNGGSGTPKGGVTEPRQSWSSEPSVRSNVPYSAIMQDYYQSQYARWDAAAQASYLSIDNAGSADDKFISYDDETTCQKKVQYAKTKGIGGTIIWELGGGYLPGSFPNRDRLLKAVKQAFGGNTSPPAAPTLAAPANNASGVETNPALTWNLSAGAASYRLQVSTNSSFSSFLVDTSNVSSASTNVVGLLSSTTYFWRVNATNEAGTSDWSTTWTFKVRSPARWQLLSVPYTVADLRKETLFPEALSEAFTSQLDGQRGYRVCDTLENGIGYWIKMPSGSSPQITGTAIVAETISVAQGWNMIGSISTIMSSSALVSDPPGMVLSDLYGFGSSYQKAETIEPGKGYWVMADRPGSLVLNSSAGVPKQESTLNLLDGLSTLALTDAEGRNQIFYFGSGEGRDAGLVARFALPPLPPEGIFDARFATGGTVEFADGEGSRVIPLLLASPTYPLTINWNQKDPVRLRATLKFGARTIALNGSGSVEISGSSNPGADAPAITLELKPALASSQPVKFVLKPNYPNPFNPSTRINYEVPAASNVTLKIYDLTGQEIKTLVDESLGEGSYSVVWDGKDHENNTVSSGVYICRMEAGGYSESIRLTFLK
ncbi:MAG TPA: glycosyl hydrolase family 18 protein [Bacteroidota bacterium]|nr:glycosyl hydrolase family 18 protein [Bacteroidota bacterium]